MIKYIHLIFLMSGLCMLLIGVFIPKILSYWVIDWNGKEGHDHRIIFSNDVELKYINKYQVYLRHLRYVFYFSVVSFIVCAGVLYVFDS